MMANKKSDKAPSEATKATEKAPVKKAAGKKKAKVSGNEMVEVVVIIAKFGTHKKGHVMKMYGSTARGCVASGAVEYKNKAK